MSTPTTFVAASRERAGTGGARATRRQGHVPGIIYGGGGEPRMMSMERRDAEKMIRKPGLFSSVIDLQIGDLTERVLPRDVQLDPVKDMPIHLDFMRVTDDTTLVVNVRIRFINHAGSPGLKRGGILNVVTSSLKVRCAVRDMPEYLTIDLNGRALGESMQVSAILPAEGVEILANDEDVVATVAIPAALRRKQMEAAQADKG